MDNQELGARIASLRQMKEFTLKEVAERANITASMLSQLENGKANPSIETLRKVAFALDIPLFSFFVDSINHDNAIMRRGTHKQLVFRHKQAVNYTLLSKLSETQLEMALMEFEPEAETVEDVMRHAGEEVAYVLEGEVTLTLENKTYTLYEGDSVHIPGGVAHRWENKTLKKVTVVFAITPPSF